jgi:chromosome segregation ATPase
MMEELRNVERQLKESHDDRDSLRMLATGLHEEAQRRKQSSELWHSRYIEVSEENETLKIAIDLVNVDNTKLSDVWNIEAKNTETLTQVNQDLQWDIANLSESLIREQRIVDFLTGQRQDE